MLDVIIVDDDSNVRHGLTNLIDWTKLGARLVLACKDGREVVEYLEDHCVDFVISDVKMPQMNGLELSKFIQSNSPDTVVVLMSAYDEFDLVQEALQYGVSKYILKPINREKINTLSKLVSEASVEKVQKKKLADLIYNSDFGRKVKKTFVEKDVKSLERIMDLDVYFENARKKVVKEYYTFLFRCLAEVARDMNGGFVFEESVLLEMDRCFKEEDYKKLLLKTYEHIIYMSNLEEVREDGTTIERIKSYIDENYKRQGISTADIAKYFNLSSSYLGSIFNKSEGCTIVDYITNKKIERAVRYIEETNFSIKYIATLVGYGDIQYFSKVFKGIMNVSPTDYAKKHRSGGNGK